MIRKKPLVKLTTNTQKILSNFASINPGMVFEVGNVQHTISPLNTIVCQTTLPEDFPQEFAIYDLDSFLKIYSKIPDAELEFTTDHCLIKNQTTDMKFYFADPQMVVVPKKKPDRKSVV